MLIQGPPVRCATHDNMGEMHCRIAHPKELDTCRLYHIGCTSKVESRIARKARHLAERQASYDVQAARIPGFRDSYPTRPQ